MRKLILLGAAAMALFASGSAAQARWAPWCAWYDPYTYNCGFHTFEQCLATIAGAGGYCARNVYGPPGTAPRRRHRAPS